MPQSGLSNRDRFINLNQMQTSRVFTMKWSTPCKRPPSALDLARSAEANWNGKRALVASERRQKSTFSSAAPATTFMRLKRRIKVFTHPLTSFDTGLPVLDTHFEGSPARPC
jgi:hypothetical protein